MIAIVTAALLFAAKAAYNRRSDRILAMIHAHEDQHQRALDSLTSGGATSSSAALRRIKIAIWHLEMTIKYTEAWRHPWVPLPEETRPPE
jgi:hypothetical protein